LNFLNPTSSPDNSQLLFSLGTNLIVCFLKKEIIFFFPLACTKSSLAAGVNFKTRILDFSSDGLLDPLAAIVGLIILFWWGSLASYICQRIWKPRNALFFNPFYGLVLRCCLWPLIRKWNLMKLCLIDLHNPMTIDMALFCNGLPLQLAPRWCWYCYQESFIPFPPHFWSNYYRSLGSSSGCFPCSWQEW